MDGSAGFSILVLILTSGVPGQVSGVKLRRVASTGKWGTTTSFMVSWTTRPESSLPITSYSKQHKRSSESEFSTVLVNKGGTSS
jgi:hypothetical protein